MELENFFIFVYGTGFAGITIIALTIQMRRQAKTTSAHLSLEMVKRMREADFRTVVDNILDNNSTACNRLDLERMLNHLEYMAAFERDELLDFGHVMMMYSNLLRHIRNDEHVQNIITEFVNDNPRNFDNLRNLLNQI